MRFKLCEFCHAELITLFSNRLVVLLQGCRFWPALCSLTGGLAVLWHTFLRASHPVSHSSLSVTQHMPLTWDTLLSLPAHLLLSITWRFFFFTVTARELPLHPVLAASRTLSPVFAYQRPDISLISDTWRWSCIALFYLPQCICAQSLTPVFVCELRCLRVPLRFLSPACCRPPFAIQMSTYEASSEAEAALCSSVSFEAIITCTFRLTQLLRPLHWEKISLYRLFMTQSRRGGYFSVSGESWSFCMYILQLLAQAHHCVGVTFI